MEHQAVLERRQIERPRCRELGATVEDAAHPQKVQSFPQRIMREGNLHDASMRLRLSDRPDRWTNEHESATPGHCPVRLRAP
jgi:hypothetical protein